MAKMTQKVVTILMSSELKSKELAAEIQNALSGLDSLGITVGKVKVSKAE